MLASPNQAGPHVEALAEIAKLVRSKTFCNALISAKNTQQIVAVFRGD